MKIKRDGFLWGFICGAAGAAIVCMILLVIDALLG